MMATVTIDLQEYEALRQRVKELEEVIDHIHEDNVIHQRRMIIKIRELTTNPHALGQQEIIEDKLINMKEVTDEIDEKIRTIEEGWKMKCKPLWEENHRVRKALDNCQRARIELELEVSRLEHRNWWQRLINK